MDSSPTKVVEPIEFGTLLGARDLDLSIRCLKSFVASATEPVRLRLHEDGTLSDGEIDLLSSELPVSGVVRRGEADEMAERELAAWPACLALRRSQVLALKLFDLPWFSRGAEIRYVDSDVLFLRPFRGAPLQTDTGVAVFFPDRQSAYSIGPRALAGDRADHFPARLNSGLFSIPRDRIDLDRVERFLGGWSGRAPVWIEQTCWALLAGPRQTRRLAPAQFRIHEPGAPDSGELVALHFVSSVRGDLPRFLRDRPQRPLPPVVETRTEPARALGAATFFLEALRRRLARVASRG